LVSVFSSQQRRRTGVGHREALARCKTILSLPFAHRREEHPRQWKSEYAKRAPGTWSTSCIIASPCLKKWNIPTPRFSIACTRFRETAPAKRCGTACAWVGWLSNRPDRSWVEEEWWGPGLARLSRRGSCEGGLDFNLYTEPEARRCGVARKLSKTRGIVF